MSLSSSSSNTAQKAFLISRLPVHVNRILYIQNLPPQLDARALWDIFIRFGPVYQIRRGSKSNNKRTAFVVYHDILDANRAKNELNGFKVTNSYIRVTFHQIRLLREKIEREAKAARLVELRNSFSNSKNS